MKLLFTLLAATLFLKNSTVNGALPNGLNTCSRSDADFNKCLAKAIENAFQTLKDGNKEFGLPPIEPFKIAHTESETIGGGKNFYLRSALKNTDVNGLTMVKVLRTATKFNKSFGLKLEGHIDKFSITGDYKMDGKIVVLPIDGEGKCNVSMTDVGILAEGRGKYFEKNGRQFVDLHSLTVKLKPAHVYYYFENLFKNDKKLSDTINSFMNENWELVTSNLIPGYETNFGKMFMEIANKIFNNVPFDEIFRE